MHGQAATLFTTRSGLITMSGVFLALVGVGIVSWAGHQKEVQLKGHQQEFNVGLGLSVAVLCGIFSSGMSFAIDAAQPMQAAALALHINPLYAALPSYVVIAAAGFWRPIDVEDGTAFQIVGRPADPLEKNCCSSQWMSITPGYLSLFRIPLLRGRDLTENDTADAPHVALINEAFARKYWPDEDPIGQHIRTGMKGELNRSSAWSPISTTAVWPTLPTP